MKVVCLGRRDCFDPVLRLTWLRDYERVSLHTADAYCAHGDVTNAVRHLRAAAFLGSEEAKEKLIRLRLAP